MDASRSTALPFLYRLSSRLPHLQLHPLQTFADVIVSYQFRGRLPFDPAGDTCVVQGKDIDDQHVFQPYDLDRIAESRPGLYSRFFLRDLDILVMNRGQHAYASCVWRAPARLIAATTFHCIRVHEYFPLLIDPRYLVWFINEPATQAYLSRQATGTTIQALSADKLRALPVAVPPLAEQHRILDLARDIDHEERLSQELTRQRRAQLSALVRARSTSPIF